MIATRGDQGFLPKYRRALELLWGQIGNENYGNPDWDLIGPAFEEAAEEAAAYDLAAEATPVTG